MPDGLYSGSDDVASSCGANGEVERAIWVLGYYWGDGGEGALVGGYVVYRGGGEAKFVGDAGDGEVVHFVVHYYSYTQ